MTAPVFLLLLTTSAQDLSARIQADAQEASQQLAVVWVTVGEAFKQFGHEAKEGGIVVGHAARTLGQEAGQGAKQVGKAVKKRAKKVSKGVKEAFTHQS